MIIRTLKLLLTAAFFLTVPNLSFAQVSLGTVIDFANGSLGGFQGGSALAPSLQPMVITDPVGGDNALQISTNGDFSGQGHALQIFNNINSDLSAVSTISFDATNPNTEDLNIRISISGGSAAGNFTDPSGAFTSNDIILQAGATLSLGFDLSASNFQQISGTDSFAQTLSSVPQLRIFHNPAVVASPFGLAGADAIGGLENPSAGTLVIDNVAFVPEPSSASLIFGAAGFLMARCRRCV